MGEHHSELAALMCRAREGCQEAARTIIDNYGEHILRVIRRRLDMRLQ